eukprot:2823334-Pleurochrysis_carterae.AAC.2
MEMDCMWNAENEGVSETAATGSGMSQWMRCRAWRAKPPKTSRMGGVTKCPRRSASWYFACQNVWGEPKMEDQEESRRGSVFAKAKVAPPKSAGERGANSRDGDGDIELEKLMVLFGCGVVHDTVRTSIQDVGGMDGRERLPHGIGTMHGPNGSKRCIKGQGVSSADLVAVYCYTLVRVTSAGAGQGAERKSQAGLYRVVRIRGESMRRSE